MKLLFVNCCISRRGGASRTRALAEAFLTAFQAAHPGSEIQEVTPETLLALKPFDVEMLNRREALAAERILTRRYMPLPGSSGRRTPWRWQRPSGTSATLRRCGRILSTFPPTA